MSQIFISHSSRDAEQAARLLECLHAHGLVETFLDFDKHAGLAPGADWERTLYREMAGAEEIMLGGQRHVFVDGAITPYNNPALVAALTAILPCYRLAWETGPDKIRVISVGTIRFSLAAANKNVRRMWVGYNVPRILAALMQGIALEQDYLCRCLGQCIQGEELDSEIGNLEGAALPGRSWCSYVRYNRSCMGQAAEELLQKTPQLGELDAVHAIPLLREIGRTYAQEHVRIEHLI